MTHKIGSKNVAQHRGKKERMEIKRTNIAREAVRAAEARALYHNTPRGQVQRERAAQQA